MITAIDRAPLHERIARALQAVIDDRSVRVAAGQIADYPEYRFETGFIAGLREAIDVVEDEVKRWQGER